MGFRETCTWVLVATALCAGNARAWDQHHYLTEAALKGLELRDPELWTRLNTPIEVHPVEALMAKAFGEGCGWDTMRDNVLEGLGKDYSVKYVEGANYS